MLNRKRVLAALLLLFLNCSLITVTVAIDPLEFSSAAEEQRFKALTEELRCLVCQNQSLADSNAELAHDLRREVFRLMKQGKTDEQIMDFLVTRYSDFVLYRPRLKMSTIILWFGPFILGIIALSVLVITIKRKNREAATELTQADQEKLKKLLEKKESRDS